jgi:chemotaxis protein histidine kinase CheA
VDTIQHRLVRIECSFRRLSHSIGVVSCRRLFKRGAKKEKEAKNETKQKRASFLGKKGKKGAPAKIEEEVVEKAPVEVKEVLEDIKEEELASSPAPPAEETEEKSVKEEEEPAKEEEEPVKEAEEETAETEEREAAPEEEPVAPAEPTPALADNAEEEDAEVAVAEAKTEPAAMTSLNDRLINLCGCTL